MPRHDEAVVAWRRNSPSGLLLLCPACYHGVFINSSGKLVDSMPPEHQREYAPILSVELHHYSGDAVCCKCRRPLSWVEPEFMHKIGLVMRYFKVSYLDAISLPHDDLDELAKAVAHMSV